MTQVNFEYDVSKLMRIKNFLVLALSIINERRENPRKPEGYLDPICEYDYICEVINMIDLHIELIKPIDKRSNELIIDAFELAGRVFHSRIISMHDYHIETKKMVDRCNGVETAYPTNLTLRIGAGKRRAA